VVHFYYLTCSYYSRRKICFSASDNYIFASFGSNSGPISDTSIRIFKNFWRQNISAKGLSKMLMKLTPGLLFGQPLASADNVAVTYNFNVKIILACGGQQVII